MVHLCRIFSVIKQFLFSHPFCILFFMFLYNIVIVLLLKKLIQYYIKICKKHTCSINVTNYIIHLYWETFDSVCHTDALSQRLSTCIQNSAILIFPHHEQTSVSALSQEREEC